MHKMTLTQIKSAAISPDQLTLNSFESSVYLVEVRLAGERVLLCDDTGLPRVFRSQLEAKKPFKGLGIARTVLVHESPYNEMIGMPGGKVDPLEVLLANPDDDLS